MAKDNQDKNFSEPKKTDPVEKCRLCKESVPKVALSFSNQASIACGWCSWICMLSDLGNDRAYAILEDKAKENQGERKRHL